MALGFGNLHPVMIRCHIVYAYTKAGDNNKWARSSLIIPSYACTFISFRLLIGLSIKAYIRSY